MPDAYRRCHLIASFIADLRAGRRRLLLALGDSNTCNTGFTAGAKQWPELLHSALKDACGTQSLLLVNAGVSGDTVHDVLARFDHDVARFRPDLVVFHIGTNDAGRLGDDEFRAGVREVLDRLAALGALVLVRTAAPMMERQPLRIYPHDTAGAAKRALLLAEADARGLPVVDIDQLWREAEARGELRIGELMADEVHTNAAGHRLVFEQLLQAFPLAQ